MKHRELADDAELPQRMNEVVVLVVHGDGQVGGVAAGILEERLRAEAKLGKILSKLKPQVFACFRLDDRKATLDGEPSIKFQPGSAAMKGVILNGHKHQPGPEDADHDLDDGIILLDLNGRRVLEAEGARGVAEVAVVEDRCVHHVLWLVLCLLI